MAAFVDRSFAGCCARSDGPLSSWFLHSSIITGKGHSPAHRWGKGSVRMISAVGKSQGVVVEGYLDGFL